ncbi:MAG TPA: hypothetical protein VFR85_13995 [Anaeromyxobacteraceae bacterium]|nr:hypothetical protein [Anaeromyxobacteraceae bacterium]
MKRIVRIGIPSLAAVAAALALPAVRAAGPAGCEPKSLNEWQLAVRQQCVEQSYVCEHMTRDEMLGDPEVNAAWREGMAEGRSEATNGVALMVGHLRAIYGCEPEGEAAPSESAPRPRAGELPPGHPPVGGEGADRLPPGHPPIDGDRLRELPPGHPPIGGTCPFAGPEGGRTPRPAGRLPFTFEQPRTTTL